MGVVTHEQKARMGTNTSVENIDTVPSISVIDLPSKFLSYPKGCEIRYRPYVFGEIKKFNQSKLTVREEIDYVLAGITTSFDKMGLTFSDVLYMGLLRKISTFGTTSSTVTYQCNHCSTINDKVIQNDEFEFSDLEVSALPIILSLGEKDYNFMPCTVGQYFELEEKGLFQDTVAVLATMCCNHSYDDAYEVFYHVHQDDVDRLDKVDAYLYHGVKPLDGVCKNCNEVTQVRLEGGRVLIRPFRRRNESVESRIRFGK